ncbi:Cullin repeat-like-containing domain protein [Scheffersomyces coipomensis]|uniref:Cullin repeat-like-containing domain protein n=1 Tax=Scheffersomyces coipomensis TaxID=1788519 RepID=UPI00315D9A1D
MEFETKINHRKSRAAWQVTGQSTASNTNTHNPYAVENSSVVKSSGNGNNSKGSSPEKNPYATNNTNRKQSRRMSIHASAAAHAHGKSFSQAAPFDLSTLPPVPTLEATVSQAAEGNQSVDNPQDIESKLYADLTNGSASEIYDYFQVLTKQREVIERDIKKNINENQKNILLLTNELKSTQDELLQLRTSKKDLEEVFGYFHETAQRRLELELEPSTSQNSTNNGNGGHLAQASNSNKRKDRSSILVLEKLWATELQSLFKHVEGASKFIQALPGRHVLAESGRWQEVNVGSWKATNLTHLFVLNDVLLIATKRTAQDGGNGNSSNKSRLQAVQSWPLNKVELFAIEPPASLHKADDSKVYCINIKSKSLSFVYQTDRYDHFIKITEAYSKGNNEMLQKERLMSAGRMSTSDSVDLREEKKQLRDSLRNSGVYEGIDESGKRLSGSHRNSAEMVLQDISARVHSRNRSHDLNSVTGSLKYNNATTFNNGNDRGQFFNDIRSLESRLDDVDVEIAHNQYAQSVGFIAHIEGKLRSIETALVTNSRGKDISDELLLIDVTKIKLQNRKESIQKSLVFDLQHNISKLSDDKVESIIIYFESFNQLDKGVESYLNAMSNYLSSTVSRLIVGVQGSTKIDVVNYLSNLVVVYISIIKRAISVYNRKISVILKKNQNGNVDSSGLINWCVEEINNLSIQIKKHLYGTLLISIGINEINKKIYKIKDLKLFKEFLAVLIPQLDELKVVGVNVDFIFEDILFL